MVVASPMLLPDPVRSFNASRTLASSSRFQCNKFNRFPLLPLNSFSSEKKATLGRNRRLRNRDRVFFKDIVGSSLRRVTTDMPSVALRKCKVSSLSIRAHADSGIETSHFKANMLGGEQFFEEFSTLHHALIRTVKGVLSFAFSMVLCVTPMPIPAIGNPVSDVIESVIPVDFSSSIHLLAVPEAAASGLVVMPPSSLNNTYYFMRSGESFWESSGRINTNPVAKTNVDNGLSAVGKEQSILAANKLLKMGACSENCWIWPSITQRAYQSAEIVAYVNGMTYSRIVPEYSFLDARGLGTFEGKRLSALEDVRVLDMESPNLRPPKYTDGTPNESVNDVLVRVTQLISILETQYSDDSVIIISPDSDNLSILECALLGGDLREHWKWSYAPGEVRKVSLSGNVIPSRTAGLLKCTSTVCN